MTQFASFINKLLKLIISLPSFLMNCFDFTKNIFQYIPEPFKTILLGFITFFAVITALKIIKNIVPAA